MNTVYIRLAPPEMISHYFFRNRISPSSCISLNSLDRALRSRFRDSAICYRSKGILYLPLMPNLNEILMSDSEMRRQCYTDDGNFAAIPIIRVIGDGHQPQGAWFGYTIRKDWLDELDMEMPTTYDELETVMEAMQDKYPTAKNPMFLSGGFTGSGLPFADPVLYGGYNVTEDWMQIDGEVKYSPLEDGYRDYIEMIHSWMEKGLIERDYTSNFVPWPDTVVEADDPYGVFPMIYTWYDGYKAANPSAAFDVEALSPLQIDADTPAHIGISDPMATPMGAISSDSEYAEIICQWWDYLFGEEGITLGNWGVEGITYEETENGEKTWIGPFLNPDNDPGFDLSMVQWQYLVYNMPGYIQADREYCLVDDKALSFIDAWDQSDCAYNYPASATMTAEENETYATLYSDIQTLVTERTLQFIMGEADMAQWDDFVAEVEGMGIDEVIGYKQAALDRYNRR